MATPVLMESASGPLELLDTYVQVISATAAFHPFCGKVVSWNGPDAGYTLRKMGTQSLVSGVFSTDMQFIPQKYSALLTSPTSSASAPQQPPSANSQNPQITASIQQAVSAAVTVSSPSATADDGAPALTPTEGRTASSSHSSDEDTPIAALCKGPSPAPPASTHSEKSYIGVRKYPATACTAESYSVRVQVGNSSKTVGQFSSAAAAGRASDFIRLRLQSSKRGSVRFNFSSKGALEREEADYAMKLLQQLQGEPSSGESFIGVRSLSSSSDTSYETRIKISKKTFNLGRYSNIRQAAAAYDCAVRIKNLNRKTNFPLDQPLEIATETQMRIATILDSQNERSDPTDSLPAHTATRSSNLQEACARFEQLSNEGPVFVCTSCRRTWFRRSMHRVTAALRDRVGESNASKWFFARLSVDNTEWICTTCYNYASKRRVPPMAPCQQPDFAVLPPALQGLTSMENDLIALRLAFTKIRGLPPSASGGPRKLGQLALKGMVTNVPADLSKIQLSLPRQISGEGTVPVSIKYKLQYRASYKTAENVRPQRLQEALRYLVMEPTLWKEADVSIRSDWLRDSEADATICNALPPSAETVSPDTSDSSDDEGAGPGREPLPEEETFMDDLFAQVAASKSVIHVAPGENQTPVGMLQDLHGEEKCFPKLFAGYARPPSTLSYSQLTRFELTNMSIVALHQNPAAFFTNFANCRSLCSTD